ncbi:DDE-type integrase/transposase/recombinase [Streptomyces sp. ISL-94]|uniref:DDE-type integrase/transposase/recombinase n=1 Tax=Streptomyces sp. ISL-94 TaxID=2819190 RepID=UPI001BE94C10|nr:DDE-type integrase/transposase/recombinase [Streptomyces sp. ISL-94]MBT2480081.1 transposase family protein [Streptomyces sp. ISL-94]
MRPARAVLDLSPGAGVVLDGTQWTVERREPHLGRVQLVASDGVRQQVSFRFLANHPDCRPSSRTASAGADRGRQSKAVEDLKKGRLELVELRMAHLLEVATGFRSGDRLRPGPGEPKPEYDPDATTLTGRRRAKVAELRAMDRQQAKLLGLDAVSLHTLIRWETGRRRFGLIGCADDRWLRESGGHPAVTEEVREAILAVREETLRGAKVSMRTKDRMIRQYVRETFDSKEPDTGEAPEHATKVPSYRTLCRVWKEWFGPGGARQRYARSADLPVKNGHVVVHRPGQVVALDTTVLPVMVRDGVFGDPIKPHLTIALDTYTHSLVAFRLTLVSDTAVDVAMLLRDVMMPLPMRADWGDELEWPYPGLPAAVVSEFAGHKVAGLPFFTPETVTTDHGAVYRNHHLVEVQRVLGCNILPSRVLRPQDKAACERAFGTCRQLLFELLTGYTGVDIADRGADPAADALLTVDEMEHLIATWIVKIWQTRQLGEYAPSWDPDGVHSPNSLFAASFAQAGLAMEIPSPELFYELLPSHYVRIDARRGVKIRGLWYDDEKILRDYRGQRSTRGGKHKGQWLIRRDPRDRRTVFFQDPITHAWHPLAWTGQPAVGQMPAFGDARVRDLLKKAASCGMKPKSDTELLPVLLELIGSAIPVSQWPTQMNKSQRTEHAREVAQAKAAEADRPATTPAESEDAQGQEAVVTVLQWPQRARQAQDSLDAERRRRREATVSAAPKPPPTLGAGFRTRSVFALPEDDDQEDADGGPPNAG